MSKDPIKKTPPQGGTTESLEDLIYRPTLSEGNRGVRKANPLVSIPTTIGSYALLVAVFAFLLKHSSTMQNAVKKTTGIDLTETEKKEDEPPPPPPPPPAPAAPVAPPRMVTRDVPPPPPINPQQEVVPEVAPRELPKQDLSLAYAGQASGTGNGPAVAGAVAGGTGMAVTGSGSSGHVQDVDFTQVKVKSQPPTLPYPPMARIARIQGTVTVRITIGLDGNPIEAKAIEGPAQLRAGAETYAMQWRFEPQLVGGVPQQARFMLSIKFTLK